MNNFFTFLEPHIVTSAKLMLRVFLGVGIVIYFIYMLNAINFPYPLDYGEAPLIDQARRLTKGEPIYRTDLTTPPYTITNYPPLYMATLSLITNLFESPFVTGRLISTVSALAAATFLGLTTYTLTQDRYAALTSGLLLLASPFLVYWSNLARVDLLALALSTAALWVLVRWSESQLGLICGGLLLVAAAYTRQSYALAAPLAALVWLWMQNRPQAYRLLLLITGIGVGVFIILNFATQGGFFFNVVTANVNAFSVARLGHEFSRLGRVMPLLSLLGIAYLFLGRNRHQGWPLIGAYLIGSLISALTVGKIGSHINYFLELIAALSLAAGALVAWSRPYPWRQSVLLILLVIQTGLMIQSTMTDWVTGWLTPRRLNFSAFRMLEGRVASSIDSGPILADEYMGLITIRNQPLYLQPFEMSQLAQAERWDQTPLLEQISRQTFPLILINRTPFSTLHQERWTPAILTAIEQHYTPKFMIARAVGYEPKTNTTVAEFPVAKPADGASSQPVVIKMLQPLKLTVPSFQPSITINPSNPNHQAIMVATASTGDCFLPACQLTLALFVSLDDGASWQQQQPFTGPQRFTFNGQAIFDSTGSLVVLGITEDTLTLNWSQDEQDYAMRLDNQRDITRSQVEARPWLQTQPQTDHLYLSFVSQYQDRALAAPSLTRSSDLGQTWSRTTPVEQYITMIDLPLKQTMAANDTRVVFGADSQLALVWTWHPEAWAWPRGVWLATSDDAGQSLSEPILVGETWGGIATTSQNDNYAILYHQAIEADQQIVLALSSDEGKSWRSIAVNGTIPLSFDPFKAPAIDIAPNGFIDILFYAPQNAEADCHLDLDRWKVAVWEGWQDTCLYDVFYTTSRDGGASFNDPQRLNTHPIQGQHLVHLDNYPVSAASASIASTATHAYAVWLETTETGTVQVQTAQIER